MPPPTMRPWSTNDDATRVRHVHLQLANQVVGRRELDVRVQVADEAQLEPLLVEITFEVEHEGLDAQLRAAKSRTVTHRQSRDEIAFGGAHPACVGSKRGDELVGLDADVCGREPELPAHVAT